jgi:hypothetical protein
VAAARERGFQIRRRWILNWVQLGLLEGPTRASRGKGGGSGTQRLWSASQQSLFLATLDVHRRTPSIPALCNIPVWLWLTAGEEYAPLSQVRHALVTWARASSGARLAAGRRVMQQTVRVIAHPRAPGADKRALRDAGAEMLLTNQFDEGRIRELLDAVIDPLGTRKPRGPAAAPLTADIVAGAVSARREALRRFTSAPPLADAWFHWARFMYLDGIASYAVDQPMLATDPDLGAWFPPLQLDRIVSDACMDLTTIVGLGLTAPPKGPIASMENPRTWLAHGYTSSLVSCPHQPALPSHQLVQLQLRVETSRGGNLKQTA